MATNYELHSDLAIPPGDYLLEVAQEQGISQAELARRMGRPAQALNEMIKGEKQITPETALQLEQVLGVPAHIWTGLEAEYQLVRARQQEAQTIEEESKLLDRFPYKEMAGLGWVEKTRDALRRVRELRRFFGVASLHNLGGVKAYAPAFRQARKPKCCPEAVAAWLRGGEMEAKRIDTAKYDATRLRDALDGIRALSRSHPQVFLPRLRDVLASCGVAFVLLPHLPKTYLNGATFWLAEKAVVMMSIRGSWADIFWFSLFHEIGHVLLHDKRHVFLEDHKEDPEWKKQETEADTFAQETLIPPAPFRRFLEHGDFSVDAISEFSNSIQIAPGIVVGRLQHDEVLAPNRNTLRERYKWN